MLNLKLFKDLMPKTDVSKEILEETKFVIEKLENSQVLAEHIIYVVKVLKINRFDWTQQRIVILTNQAMYIFNKKRFRSRNIVEDVQGIVINSNPDELIIHIPRKHDQQIYIPDNQKNIFIYYLMLAKFYSSIDKDNFEFKILKTDISPLNNYVYNKDKKLNQNKEKNSDIFEKFIGTDYKILIPDLKITIEMFTEKFFNMMCYNNKLKAVLAYTDPKLSQESENNSNKFISSFYETNNPKKLISMSSNISKSLSPKQKDKTKKNMFSFSQQEVIKIIGQSPCTRTYLCRNKVSHSTIILKYYKKWLLCDKSTLVELEDIQQHLKNSTKEVKIGKKHDRKQLYDGTLKIEGIYDTPGQFFFIFDNKQLGDLRYHLDKNKTFNEHCIIKIIKPILESMEQLHYKQKVILDLTPENILIDNYGRTFINLYSSNKMNIIYKHNNQFVGSLPYLAPELLELTYIETFANKNRVTELGQLKAKSRSYMGTITKAVDYWALGIIIYELLTGVTPFLNEYNSVTSLLVRNLDIHFPKTVEASPMIKDQINLLLEKDLKKRLDNFKDRMIKNHPFFDQLLPIEETKLDPFEVRTFELDRNSEESFIKKQSKKYEKLNMYEDIFEPCILFCS